MNLLSTLAERIQEVDRRITAACERSGRDRHDVNVVAVTKYVSLDNVREVVAHDVLHLGENRWQNAKPKWEAFSGLPANEQPVWHYIGSLQSNKAKDVIGKFTYIHSLDRVSLAEAIADRADKLGLVVPCFIQVNVSGEASKQGLEPEELEPFIQTLKQFPSIKPIGLMTMAPFEAEPEETRPVFRELRMLRDRLNAQGILDEPLTELSMGMSNDFEVAIEEGATWVRLGTILVGKEEA
ncbi:YggS family pyridoxal phosphate-dependent enzyme [Paenibacillus sp. MMS18-CY102]|uniref:YggS family pyridoxal phosphate-dependent enzyme n=1 Tax=Paenibacillus sp. MMS18-CY102 TaxID=2682849 RepID=UPI0013663F09|nr:YggS family pyridoxal phosphate-dependent enzyme [Paenibacillus sp. MMS18-CY102]